jgi:hypothetical protein
MKLVPILTFTTKLFDVVFALGNIANALSMDPVVVISPCSTDLLDIIPILLVAFNGVSNRAQKNPLKCEAASLIEFGVMIES